MKYDSSAYFHQFYDDWYNMHDDIVLSNTRLLKWPYYNIILAILCYCKIPCRKNCVLLQNVWNMNFTLYFICYWTKDNAWSRLGHWSLPVATMLSNLIGQKGATLLFGHYKRSNNKKRLDQQYTDLFQFMTRLCFISSLPFLCT